MSVPGRLPQRLLQRVKRLFGSQVYALNYGWGPRLMSALRKRWILFAHRHADIRFEGSVHIGPGFSLQMPAGGTLVVGAGTEFRHGFRAEIFDGGRVVIGQRCIFSHYALIQCSTSVEIGDGAGIGQSCAIFDGNHRFRDLSLPWKDQGFDFRPIRIGAEAAVLSKSTVVNDVGERSQVGAGSVVIRPIPAFCIAVGAPARVIDYFGPEEQRPPELDARSDG